MKLALLAAFLTLPVFGQTLIGPPGLRTKTTRPHPPQGLLAEYVVHVPCIGGTWTGNGWHDPVLIPQWDLRLGRPRLARITFETDHEIDLAAENQDLASACTWTWHVEAEAALATPRGQELVSDAQAWSPAPWELEAYDLVPDGAGPSGRSETLTASGEESITLVGRSLLQFMGTGSTSCDLERSGAWHFDATTGNLFGSHSRRSGMTIRIQYF